jgi:hypothetical protein
MIMPIKGLSAFFIVVVFTTGLYSDNDNRKANSMPQAVEVSGVYRRFLVVGNNII